MQAQQQKLRLDESSMDNHLFAFGLTLFAGLSTGVGSLIALVARTTNRGFLSVSLGFSAGVMIYISMIEIFQKARAALEGSLGTRAATAATVAGFFSGMLLIALIDRLIPSYENPHEMRSVEETAETETSLSAAQKLQRLGLFAAVAIGIHNFPEGLATFMSALQNPATGIAVAVAIAIHNIPEGISVSVPIYFSTGSRRKAFYYSFLSGIAEPLGAVIGFTLLKPFINDRVFGIVFAGVAGIMVFISLDQLLPTARQYGKHHHAVWGLVGGMAIMAVSLLLFL